MMKETRTEVQQLNQRHKQSEETRHNQDIQIAILRQEIKSLQTNVAAPEEKQSSVHTELRYLQKSYHHLQIQLDAVQVRERLLQYHADFLKNIGSGDKSRNGENSSTEHTPVRTPQSPLTRGASAGTHHNVTAREPHRAFTNDPPVINGGGLKSDGKLHKRLKSVRCKILGKIRRVTVINADRIKSKHQQRAYMDTIVSQHKMMLEGKLLKNITFNSGSVQEETVSEPTMSKTTMQLEQKIESKDQSEIEDVSDKSGSQGHCNWPRLFSIFMFNFGTMWGIVGTYNSYNSAFRIIAIGSVSTCGINGGPSKSLSLVKSVFNGSSKVPSFNFSKFELGI
jgi:hypothetical protein